MLASGLDWRKSGTIEFDLSAIKRFSARGALGSGGGNQPPGRPRGAAPISDWRSRIQGSKPWRVSRPQITGTSLQ